MKYFLAVVAVLVGSVMESASMWLPGVGVAGGACYLIGAYYTRKEFKDKMKG